MEEKYGWKQVDHPQQVAYMTWVSFVDFKPIISRWKFIFIHAYYELAWGIQKLGSHWRIQVNFKKAKNKESSSNKALITHNSRSLYLMESWQMVDCQILILMLWPSRCSNGCKYFLAQFNLIALLLPWPRHRVKSQVLKWIKCYVRNSNTYSTYQKGSLLYD